MDKIPMTAAGSVKDTDKPRILDHGGREPGELQAQVSAGEAPLCGRWCQDGRTNFPLAHLLRNRFYIGEVKFKGEIFRGEQPAIVD